jgi:hypothetical protein
MEDQLARIQDKINYLIEEKERIESTGCPRVDEDFVLTYYFITEEISRLQLELFQQQYQIRFGNREDA